MLFVQPSQYVQQNVAHPKELLRATDSFKVLIELHTLLYLIIQVPASACLTDSILLWTVT